MPLQNVRKPSPEQYYKLRRRPVLWELEECHDRDAARYIEAREHQFAENVSTEERPARRLRSVGRDEVLEKREREKHRYQYSHAAVGGGGNEGSANVRHADHQQRDNNITKIVRRVAAELYVDIEAEMPARFHLSDPLPILTLFHVECHQVLRVMAKRHNLPFVVSKHVVQLDLFNFVKSYCK